MTGVSHVQRQLQEYGCHVLLSISSGTPIWTELDSQLQQQGISVLKMKVLPQFQTPFFLKKKNHMALFFSWHSLGPACFSLIKTWPGWILCDVGQSDGLVLTYARKWLQACKPNSVWRVHSSTDYCFLELIK